VSVLSVAAGVSAQTEGLERVGPVQPANGFPAWYQDKTGLTLEFCQPTNQAELDGGWCLLLPGDTTVPEVFPTTFADEHFYWAGDAKFTQGNINALLVLGMEAAFAVGPVIQGDQIVFGRVRIRIDGLAPNKLYNIQHPYGTDALATDDAGEINFTEDLGITCARGDFSCALNGRIGPFLLPSANPGGAELAPVTGPVVGKLYIADPAREGPVTGSPVGQNWFRIIDPVTSTMVAGTDDFVLMGRVFQGIMPGRVDIDRASYARVVETGKIDVFATATPTRPARIPGMLPSPVVLPALDFFAEACAAGANGALTAPASAPFPMVSEGSRYYGQIPDAPIPAAVCVRDNSARDASGQAVPIFRQAPVADVVTIKSAVYDPGNGSLLKVEASSSDAFAPPVLSALLIGPLTGAPIATGQVQVMAPPAKVHVTSARLGTASLDVSTVAGALPVDTRPVAGNDVYGINEDSGVNVLNVIENDTKGGVAITAADSPVVTITALPGLGVATANADGSISYTPNANAFGNDLLTYTVTIGTETSSPAFVSIIIANVNDAPVAADDAANGTGGLAIPVNLFLNDSDPDGQGDLVSVNILTSPSGVTWSTAGGVLTVSGGAGTHLFTYQAVDAAGALSNVANVSVTIAASENITITRSDYIQNKRRWRVEGTDSVAGGQQVFIMYANGTFADGTSAAGYLVGTTSVLTGGLWALDFAVAGTNDPRNPTSNLFSVRPTQIYAITNGGAAPPRAINLR
jgi:hypothetical protein